MTMFRRTDTPTAPEPPAAQPAPNPADDLIPLSVLALDLEPPAVGGWRAYLADLGVKVKKDYVGRDSISAIDAHWLLAERRNAEDRARELAEQADAEREAQRVARLVPGTPWHEIPEGVTAAEMWAQREKDALPRRESVLEHALRREEGFFIHPIGPGSDAA